jgi:hypothetical protein
MKSCWSRTAFIAVCGIFRTDKYSLYYYNYPIVFRIEISQINL